MIAGSMVALVTPMDAQGHLDWDSLGKLVDFHLQEGTNAIVAVGTTGESATLDVEEHIQVIEFVVKRVAGDKVKLLANHLDFVAPGALLAAMTGKAEWPHNVYRMYWPLARSDSFAAQLTSPAGASTAAQQERPLDLVI